MAKLLGLPIWDKPASACLSSRIPYGTSWPRDRLAQIGGLEGELKVLGFRQVRVRFHDKVARIEVAIEELERVLAPGARSHRRRRQTSRLHLRDARPRGIPPRLPQRSLGRALAEDRLEFTLGSFTIAMSFSPVSSLEAEVRGRVGPTRGVDVARRVDRDAVEAPVCVEDPLVDLVPLGVERDQDGQSGGAAHLAHFTHEGSCRARPTPRAVTVVIAVAARDLGLVVRAPGPKRAANSAPGESPSTRLSMGPPPKSISSTAKARHQRAAVRVHHRKASKP